MQSAFSLLCVSRIPHFNRTVRPAGCLCGGFGRSRARSRLRGHGVRAGAAVRRKQADGGFCGAPLIANALALAALPLLARRIVVTRSEEVEAFCNAQGVPVLRHAQPYRSDTVRLGLAALLGKEPALRGCLFLPGDQPLLTQQSVEALALAAAPDAIVRLCAADGTPGSPVLFGADYFRSCFTCRMAAAAMPLRGPTPVPSALCPPGTMPN